MSYGTKTVAISLDADVFAAENLQFISSLNKNCIFQIEST